jgi:hypothetical protein
MTRFFLALLLFSSTANAGETILVADAGVATNDLSAHYDMGVRTGHHFSLGPIVAGPEVGVRRMSPMEGNADPQVLAHAGGRVGIELLLLLSVFHRWEGIGGEDLGPTTGIGLSLNKIPFVTLGVHAAWTSLGGDEIPSVGAHAGVRF